MRRAIKPPPQDFGLLPDGVLLCIFAFLDLVDRVRVAQVCKDWCRVQRGATAWGHILLDADRLSEQMERRVYPGGFDEGQMWSYVRFLALRRMAVNKVHVTSEDESYSAVELLTRLLPMVVEALGDRVDFTFCFDFGE
jgi:hypothetical protein